MSKKKRTTVLSELDALEESAPRVLLATGRLIDEKGVLRQEWRKVKVKGHAEEVLAAVRA